MTLSAIFRGHCCGLLIALVVFTSQPRIACAQDSRLTELRNDFAMRFLEPEPHMALAKYYLDRGNRLQAFYILENARRTRFEESVFIQSFQLTFRAFDFGADAEAALLQALARDPQSLDLVFKLADVYLARGDWAKAKDYLNRAIKLRPDEFKYTNGLAEVLRIEGKPEDGDRLVKDYVVRYPESEAAYALKIEALIDKEPVRAKSLLTEALQKFPKSGNFLFNLGRVLQREGKLPEAEETFVRAAGLSPDSPDIQAWVGRFFYKVRENQKQALEYYLNAYFLNPHTYETEFVESRIQKIGAAIAQAEYDQQVKAGVPLTKMLDDPNPVVVSFALEQISEKWKPSHLEAVLKCMDHDDAGIRWQATETIKSHADRSFDEKLKALLKDTDLRKRGLAAYLAVHLWKSESFGIIKSMLTEQSQLLRFDALSALILEGGAEGRRIAFEHATDEPNPKLKKLIELSKQKRALPP